MKKVIVTGHTGFIGSYVINYLQQKKYHVIGISRNKLRNSNFNQFKIDIDKINEKKISGKIFGVIHCAGITDVQYCQDNPDKCFKSNLSSTQKMLEFSRKKKCKFIYLSSSHVYGKPETLPIKENHKRNPTSIYSASKYAAEICCESYSNQYSLDVTILRPFSVYGPNEADHFVVPRIISQLKNNNKIEIGNLYPKRDFIFVIDVVNAIELVLRKSRGFNVFNIGTGKAFSINDVCKILIKISGKKIKVNSKKSFSRKIDIDKIISNSSSLKKLGWKPKISLAKGLEITYNWYLNNTQMK